MSTSTSFETWKTVKVGNLGSADSARQQLIDAGVLGVGKWWDDVLGQITFKETEATLQLVRPSVKELGLKTGATTAKIYAAAHRHGLSLCPAEVAPQLWLTYPNLLERDEVLVVAMEPIIRSNGTHRVFYVGYDHVGRWCNVLNGHPKSKWSDHLRWIFVRK